MNDNDGFDVVVVGSLVGLSCNHGSTTVADVNNNQERERERGDGTTTTTPRPTAFSLSQECLFSLPDGLFTYQTPCILFFFSIFFFSLSLSLISY